MHGFREGAPIRGPHYHCIPSFMFALCMPSDKVVYKSNMQGDKIHATRTSRNPMQSAVVLSVNTIILPILEGLKDKTQELKFDFNAARTYKEWLHNSHGGGVQEPPTRDIAGF